MESDWTVACGADDPMVALPWANADRSLRFVDLRAHPEAIDDIPEAQHYSIVKTALARWNQPGAPVFTAKCDVWSYPADLFDANDLTGFAYAHGSYVDLLPADPTIFSNFSDCEKLLRVGAEMAQSISSAEGRCEWTLRPARIFPAADSDFSVDAPHIDGFAITLYVWGYGDAPQAAESAWSSALSALIEPVVLAFKAR